MTIKGSRPMALRLKLVGAASIGSTILFALALVAPDVPAATSVSVPICHLRAAQPLAVSTVRTALRRHRIYVFLLRRSPLCVRGTVAAATNIVPSMSVSEQMRISRKEGYVLCYVNRTPILIRGRTFRRPHLIRTTGGGYVWFVHNISCSLHPTAIDPRKQISAVRSALLELSNLR